MRKLLFFFLFTGLFLFSKGNIEFVEDEVIVKFKKEIPKISLNSKFTLHNLIEKKSFKFIENLYVLKITDGKSVKEKINELRKDPDVIYAEPNYIRRVFLTPNDQYFSNQWGLHNTGQPINGIPGTYDADINGPEAWDITQGDTSVVVAIIDSGVDYTHSDLVENMWENPDEIQNGRDDDNNGYIDDIYGINAINGTGNPMDDHGHGTHVAGIIGAVGNNNNGISGVNWKVKIMALKFIGETGGGTDADAIECIQYVINMKRRGVNIVATNNSWGGYEESQAIVDAINQLLNEGVLFIAASGNDAVNIDYIPVCPAGTYLPNVITVAATDKNNNMVFFSNYGKYKVDVGAPGDEIYSTLPGNRYWYASGTSMATPFVTGLSALIKAKYPDYNWVKIKNLILTGGKNLFSLNNKTITGKIIRANTSLSPVGNIILSRLRPIGNKVSCYIGDSINISVLHIKDENPNGNITATVNETGETINLLDNGNGFDKFAGDGIYSGTWTPPYSGKFTISLPNNDNFEVYVLNKYNYQPTNYNWRDFSGTNLNMTDESTKEIIDLPFPVKFGDYSPGFNKLYVNSNGLISFFDEVYSYIFSWDSFPIPEEYLNIQILPFRDDLYPDGNNNVFYGTIGSPGNREFIIEWRNVPHYSYRTGGITFQVVFFENSSDILFNYKDVIFGNSNFDRGANASIGIQISPYSATQYSWRSPSLSDNFSILWKTETVSPPSGAPDKPVNISPYNGQQNVSINPELVASQYSHPDNIPFSQSRWQIRKYGSTYQNPVYDVLNGPTNTHQVQINLENSTVYFWRVRYKDANNNWSSWSDETSFTTSPNRPPSQPYNVYPENDSINIPLNPVLIGSKFDDPDGDNLFLAQWRIREDGQENYKWQSQNSSNSIEVPSGGLEYNKKYWWSVRYSDPNGNWSAWSFETNFITISEVEQPPIKPQNISPFDGKTDVDTLPLLVATGFSDPDGDIMLNSHWQIREENGSYLNPYWEKEAGPLTSIKVDKPLEYNKKYYWRVKYQDEDGNWSAWSDETGFITVKQQSSQQPETGGSGGGGCFIATCCFGENSWQVKILKEFRDRYLLKNSFGKKFVKFYYKVSPEIAEILKRNLILKIFVKLCLIPFVIISLLIVKNYLILFLSTLMIILTFFKKTGKIG